MENGINIELLKDKAYSNLDKPWMPKIPNNVAINVNKFIAKYDFEIAQKFKPTLRFRKEHIVNLFNKTAVQEILDICCFDLSSHQKHYKSIWTLDGDPIRDLNDLPDDTRICLVSENPYPRDPILEEKLKMENQEEKGELSSSSSKFVVQAATQSKYVLTSTRSSSSNNSKVIDWNSKCI